MALTTTDERTVDHGSNRRGGRNRRHVNSNSGTRAIWGWSRLCRGSGGFAVAHVGDFRGVHGGFFRGRAFIGRSPFVSRLFVSHRQFVAPFTPISAFYSYGPSYQSGGQFITPVDGVGVFHQPYLSCWTWVPADFDWQRVWECK
jgi:hypothetical protein